MVMILDPATGEFVAYKPVEWITPASLSRPIVSTRQGVLTQSQREARADKNARNKKNREARRQENMERSARSKSGKK